MVVSPVLSISLLDRQSIQIPIDLSNTVAEVCRVVTARTNVRSRDARLFGLAKVDKRGHFHWLDEERSIGDYVDKSHKSLDLSHNIRYFVDSVFDLEEVASIELYFLEAHQQIQRGEIDLSYIDYVKSAACLLQVYAGDYQDDRGSVDLLRTALPSSLRLHEEQDKVEQEVLEQYRALRGLERGTAMIRFMNIVEKCDRYGSRLYHVLDRSGTPSLLGINNRGIHIYQSVNEFRPTQVFPWTVLDNLYYRNEEFSIEVRQNKRIVQSSGDLNCFLDLSMHEDDELARAANDPTTQVSVSRRSISAAGVQSHRFVCESHSLCKAIWTSAISQHQFFLDQKARRPQNGNSGVDHRELNDKLNRLISKSSIGSSLPSLSSLHSVGNNSLSQMPAAKVSDGSSLSLPSIKSPPNQKSEEERAKDLEVYNKLKSRRQMLEEKLRERMKELLAVCMKEGEFTGKLPEEIKKALFPGQEIPKLKKRMGTSFSIPEELIKADRGDKMNEMVTDVEIHRKIVAAAERLAKDKSMNKSVRKKRRKDFQAATQKLRGLEMGLSQMRLSASKPDISSMARNESGNSWAAFAGSADQASARMTAKSCPTTPRGSVPDLCPETGEKSEYEDDEPVPRRAPSVASRRSLHQRYSEASSSSSSSLGLSCGGPRRSLTQRSITSDELDNPLISPIYENVGYRSTSYRSSYRQAHYPTIQDEQHQRKRALSAHALSSEDRARNSSVVNQQREHNTPVTSGVDNDLTPTADQPHPIRRMATSASCSAGFTSSLDRRALPRAGMVLSPSEATRRNPSPRGASPATHRVTTFPVSHPNTSFESSAFPRFQAPMGRLSHFPPRGPLPPYQGNQSISSSRLPINTDPQMEALLDYYKAEARKSSQKTATIV